MNKLSRKLVTVGLASVLLLLSTNGVASAEVHYKDVRPTDNFYNAVDNLLDYNAISDTLPKFNPYDNVTRGQASSIIAKLLGLDVSEVENPNFTDVSTSHQFYKYISVLQNKGILGGKSDGTFGVNEPLTRGQMSAILINAFDIPLVGVQNVYNNDRDRFTKSTDIMEDKSRYTSGAGEANLRYEDYKFKGQWGQHIGTMNYFGFINGTGDGNFKPNQPIKRSQLANMLYQIQIKDINKRYVFIDSEEFVKLGVTDRTMSEENGVIKSQAWVTDHTSYYHVYDIVDDEDRPYRDPDYLIIEPRKEGQTYFTRYYSEKLVKVIVSKDSEDNWKVDVEQVEEELSEIQLQNNR